MTVQQPIGIGDQHTVELIIDAVRTAYVKKPVTIPEYLDREALAADILRATMIYRIRLEMQRGQWNERQRRGRKLLKAKTVGEILALLESDDIGRWWQQSLLEIIAPRELHKLGSPNAGEAIGVVRRHVSLLLDERFTFKGSPHSARTLLGTGSALDWLIRRPSNLAEHESCCLPTIFERHFGLTARINISHKLTGTGPRDYTRSPYLEFVRAVLISEGIKATPGTIRTIFNRN